MNYEAILKKLQEYYSNLLIVQYHGKTKAKATVEKLVNLIYANMILLQIEYAYDWKTATGKQLDIIGQWVGVNRSYNLPALQGRTLFAYPQTSRLYPRDNTSDRQHGYSTYDTYSSVTDGGMLRYDDLRAIDRQLTDDEFRVVIGLKIIFNNINHTAGEIDEAVWKYFGGLTYYYKAPMSLDTSIYSDKELTNKVGQVYNLDNFTIGDELRQTEFSFSEEYNGSPNVDTIIQYINGYYFILQFNGSLSFSSNLTDWEIVTLGTNALMRIVYFNDTYYVFDRYGYYFTSSDLLNWSEGMQMSAQITYFYDITYGKGKFVASINNNSTGQVSISEDLINWSEPIHAGTSYSYSRIYFLDNKFLLVSGSQQMYSYDGINWDFLKTISGRGFTLQCIAYGNGIFVGTNASGSKAISKDGINWSFYSQRIDNPRYQNIRGTDIIFANNKFWIVMNNLSGTKSRINVSEDGVNWKLVQETSNWIRNWTVGIHKIVGTVCESLDNRILIDTVYSDIEYDIDTLTSYPYSDYSFENSSNNVQSVKLGNVYTTWQPHTLIYNYPENLEKVMDYCEYKGILPAPTGVNIQTSLYH